MKADPTELIRAHYATLINVQTKRTRHRDYALFVGVPAVVGGYTWFQGSKLSSGACTGLLTVAGLLSAFLFGVMLQVSERAMDWSDSGPMPSRDVTDHSAFLRELAANSGYASLVSFATAGVFVAASATSHTALEVLSIIGLALIAHLGLNLMLVITRVYGLTVGRLNKAETGHSHDAEVRHFKKVG